MNKVPKQKNQVYFTAKSFEALTDSQKNQIVREIESESPQRRLARSKALTPRQRAAWRKFRKNLGRPKVGKVIFVI
jgi:hypothetical protein